VGGAARARIMFVDDEPAVLHGLRRILEPYEGRWRMHWSA